MPQQLKGNIRQLVTIVAASADMDQEGTGPIIDLQSKDQFVVIISICSSLSYNIVLLVDFFHFVYHVCITASLGLVISIFAIYDPYSEPFD